MDITDDDRRRAALVAFLGAGLDPAPSRATLVSALADARRAVAALRSRDESISEWLVAEVRFRGIKENAAILAALEVTNDRDSIAVVYRQRYPLRAEELDEILECL